MVHSIWSCSKLLQPKINFKIGRMEKRGIFFAYEILIGFLPCIISFIKIIGRREEVL